MTTKSFILRFYAIIMLACIGSGLLTGALSFGIFEIIKDRQTDGQWFANFLQGFIAGALGLIAGFVAYCIVTLRSAKRFLGERYSRGNYLRIVSVPLFLFVFLVGTYFVALPFFSGTLLDYLAPLLIAGAIAFPVGSKVLRILLIVGTITSVSVIGLIQQRQLSAVYEAQYNEERAEAVDSWNGPLVLASGTSGHFMPSDWTIVTVSAPYSNESWSAAELFNRRVNPDGSEDNATVKMFNTSISSDPCRYESSCSLIGQSKFGPVYKIDYSSGYALDVDGGHLEVDIPREQNVVAVIDSLELVDAATYTNALKGWE